MIRTTIRAVLPLAALALAACATPPLPSARPAPPPAAWSQTPPPAAATTRPWWQAFASPALDALVAQALAHNHDVKAAAANLAAATALVRDARLAMLPAGGVTAGAERRREAAAPQIAQFPELSGRFPTQSLVSAGFDLAWEVDLAGRLADERAAARATAAEQAWLAEAARQEAVTATVRAWLEAGVAGERAARLAERCTALGRIATAQAGALAAGAATAADVAEAGAAAAACTADAGMATALQRNALKRLAVLSGQRFDALLATPVATTPAPVPDALPAIDPAETLRRRPDVDAAEMAARAALAQAGAARGLLYPRIQFAGSAGLLAPPGTLGTPAALGFGFGPRLEWGIFNLGRTRAQIAASDARANAALARWEGTTLRALEEADAGLEHWSASMRQWQAACAAATAAGQRATATARRLGAGDASALDVAAATADAGTAALACAETAAQARTAYVVAAAALGLTGHAPVLATAAAKAAALKKAAVGENGGRGRD